MNMQFSDGNMYCATYAGNMITGSLVTYAIPLFIVFIDQIASMVLRSMASFEGH
jgi:hypothetical protein